MLFFFQVIDQHCVNTQLREFHYENLMLILEKDKPLLVEHIDIYLRFINRMVSAAKIINTHDQNFFNCVIMNCELPLDKVIRFLDHLANLYFQNIVNPPQLLMNIMTLLRNYFEDPKIKNFCIVLYKISLTRYLILEKKRKRPLGSLIYFSHQDDPKTITKEILSELVISQKKALIIELLKEFVYLDDREINKKFKMLQIYANLMYKNHIKEKDLGFRDQPDNKGIIAVLGLFGDPDELIKKWEIEAEFLVMMGHIGTQDDVKQKIPSMSCKLFEQQPA